MSEAELMHYQPIGGLEVKTLIATRLASEAIQKARIDFLSQQINEHDEDFRINVEPLVGQLNSVFDWATQRLRGLETQVASVPDSEIVHLHNDDYAFLNAPRYIEAAK